MRRQDAESHLKMHGSMSGVRADADMPTNMPHAWGTSQSLVNDPNDPARETASGSNTANQAGTASQSSGGTGASTGNLVPTAGADK